MRARLWKSPIFWLSAGSLLACNRPEASANTTAPASPQAVPVVSPEPLPEDAIDRLLVESWRAAGVEVADPASDEEFLRRVTLDLVGRIPTAAELSAFQNDTRADKRPRATQALLNSPEWAEYWGGVYTDLLVGQDIKEAGAARPMREWLSAELGRPVEYVHVPDYTAAVTALAANKLDFVWLGGVTAVQAEERTKGKVEFIAARETDMHFKSYVIANAESLERAALTAVNSTEPMPLSQLAAMKPAFADLTFSFGSKSSTSGHIMPRHFLQSEAVGIDPETDFRSPAGYQLKGGHSATLRAVASGAVDLGAINYTVWDRADEATKSQAPVIYVTPEYVDYCMVAHQRMGEAELSKLRQAMLALDAANPEHAKVLEAFGAKRFVEAKSADWEGIRSVLGDLRAKGMLD